MMSAPAVAAPASTFLMGSGVIESDAFTTSGASSASVPKPTTASQQPLESEAKYRMAGDITNEVLRAVLEACVAGADISAVCKLGDDLLIQKTERVYKKRTDGVAIARGIAFPTCVSVNEIAGHFSPLPSSSRTLEAGDLVKIDIGCHIDGFIAVAAHSLVVPGPDGDSIVTGRRADVIVAAWNAAQATLRLLVPGNSSKEVPRIIEQCVKPFSCSVVQGIVSHELKQHIIDGTKCLVMKETPDVKGEKFDIAVNDVFAVDILVSTGEGKLKESDVRTTVFKRQVDQVYTLRTQLSRQFLKEVQRRFPTLPFSLRAIEDERMARLGVAECVRHNLLQAYPVLREKPGELVAQFKFTVLVTASGPRVLSGLLPYDPDNTVKSEYKIEEESLLTFLMTEIGPKKRKPTASVGDDSSSSKTGTAV